MNSNLLEQKRKNELKTWLLMALVTGILLLLGTFFARQFNNPMIFNGFLIFALVQNLISFWFSDKLALSASGAKPADRQAYPKLYEIVERIALKTSTKVPRVYIINDPAPNAFATGRNQNNAAIAVTTGILEILSDDELEGVLAHEFGHIQNKDILVNTVAGVLIGFIVMILNSMGHLGMGRSSDGEDNRGAGLMIVFAILAAFLAPLFGQLIQLAISRKREFLADATGALTTNHPEHLAKALQKISDHSQPMRQINPSTSHLFIANPAGKLKSLFMSHPPVQERIDALLGRQKNDGFR